MAIWYKMWPLWASMEKAIKMQYSEEGMKLNEPSGYKWEQKWCNGQTSFVFFRKFLYKHKNSRHFKDFVQNVTKFVLWLYNAYPQVSQLRRKKLILLCILTHLSFYQAEYQRKAILVLIYNFHVLLLSQGLLLRRERGTLLWINYPSFPPLKPCVALLRKDSYFKTLPVRKLLKILALPC